MGAHSSSVCLQGARGSKGALDSLPAPRRGEQPSPLPSLRASSGGAADGPLNADVFGMLCNTMPAPALPRSGPTPGVDILASVASDAPLPAAAAKPRRPLTDAPPEARLPFRETAPPEGMKYPKLSGADLYLSLIHI